MRMRAAPPLVLLGALACASSNAPRHEAVTRVDVSSGAGTLVVSELHDDPAAAVRTLPSPPDSVWHALPRVYEMLGIDGAGAAPGQSLFGARNFRPRRIEGKRLSTYIDCGMGTTATPKADEYAITMTLVSRVDPATDAGTRVETVMQATAKPRATAGNPVSCQSNGRLEKRVGDLLALVLVSGPREDH
ncbi:MAG TPA: hypothetical protein VMM12_11520 [Longimicrobiales bacterium]|nr:hypothetical protein [Longimicrobiales bacterium]